MKKTTKGALAAAASASLLLGGAGSLAYWNTTDSVTAGSFTTGNLILDAANCDAAGWTVTNTIEGVNAAAVDLANFDVVPGDKFTKTCTVAITAVGDNLRASLAVVNGTGTPVAGPDAANLDADDYLVTQSFLIDNVARTSITDADGGNTIDVTITVDFPIGAAVDNDSKVDTLNLSDYTVTATQAQS